MSSHSTTDQKVVLLLPLRKNLDGSPGTLCTNSKLKPNLASRNSQVRQREAILIKAKAKQMCSATSQKKHKCLDISVKVKVLEFGKQSPKLGTKKLADHFGICKTQIHAVLKNKEAMRDAYASNEIPNHRKRKSSKYSDMNHTLWDWYTMCRKTDILVSGSMLHEKAMLIAATLEISNFVTSNGWCEKVRQKYRICNKTVE